MHPNNTRRGKQNHNIKMDLTALPDPEPLKVVPLQLVGFYMMVWMSAQELKAAPGLSNELEDRLDVLCKWMLRCEEHLPLWFATRYLR